MVWKGVCVDRIVLQRAVGISDGFLCQWRTVGAFEFCIACFVMAVIYGYGLDQNYEGKGDGPCKVYVV